MFRTCIGLNYKNEEVLQTGERIFNLKNKSVITSLENGKADGLNKMLLEYYVLRGWDKEGVPTEAKMAELSID